MYMYITCTYMFILVHNFINMYIHVCTMYRALCTDLQILVHVVRIPDDGRTIIAIIDFKFTNRLSSGIPTPPIYFDILGYHTEIC